MKNLYDVLELEKNCTSKEIKDSYINLSKKYHPDKNKSDEAKKKILEINEAYSVLKNASTRNRYDEKLRFYGSEQKYKQGNVCQNSRVYYNRSHYDDYGRYHQKMANQGYAEPHIRKFTLVLCCCVLMFFGAGLRIMYAWADTKRRKKLNEMLAQQIEEEKLNLNPKLKEMQLFFQRKHKQEMKEEKLEP